MRVRVLFPTRLIVFFCFLYYHQIYHWPNWRHFQDYQEENPYLPPGVQKQVKLSSTRQLQHCLYFFWCNHIYINQGGGNEDKGWEKKTYQSFFTITRSNFTQNLKSWTFLNSLSSWLLKNVQDNWIWAKFDQDMSKIK